MLNLTPPLSVIFYVGLLTLLCVSFTFTYMIEGFPNFAQTSYTIIGTTFSYYFARYWYVSRYGTWLLSTLMGGIIGVGYYFLIVKPIRRTNKNQDITLTFTFLVVSTLIPYFHYIFNWWAYYVSEAPTVGENLLYQDFYINNVPGVFILGISPIILIIIGINLFLQKTKTGISLKATSENEELASVLGINVNRVHILSWFISGSLSTLVGCIGLYDYEGLIISVMAGSILGGLNSIPGAILGGCFIAFGESISKEIMFRIFSINIDQWQGLLPILFLIIILLFYPNGVFGTKQ